MNELLPYESALSQQWIDLPLPDENMAWADMKRRLDEEDKKRVIPFWLTGCAGWALLAVLLLGLAWWIFRPEKWFTNKQGTERTDTLGEKRSDIKKDTQFNYTDTGVTQAHSSGDSILQPNKKDSSDINVETVSPEIKKLNTTGTKGESLFTTEQKIPGKKKRPTLKIDQQVPGKKKKPADKNVTDTNIPDKVKQNELPKDSVISAVGIDKPKTDSVINNITKADPFVDTIQKLTKDSVIKKPDEKAVANDNRSKTDSSKKKTIIFSAGIGLHQQLPVAGQTLVPYSSLGRKGSLGDYIPSVYIRMEKEKTWFIQSGFRYGAPQLVKEFLYSRRGDTISPQKYNVTSSYLRKTFYHQLPLTVNYFVLPNLSIGAGVVWNKFSSAVSSRDIRQIDLFNGGDTAISTGTIFTSRGADSNFVNSFFQASVELQYKWKRLSFGANYSFGLQPYIRFILPGGVLQEEKNKSLHLFIRYELWRSKKK